MLNPPKGFEDPADRKQAAELICQLLDAYDQDSDTKEKFARYKLAQDVCDEKIVMSHLSFVKEIEPFQVPLIKRGVEGIVTKVSKPMNGSGPMFSYSGGQDLDLRENREHDNQLALESDGFQLKVREMIRTAATKMRCPYRVTYQTLKRGEGFQDPASLTNSDIAFSGPTMEPLDPFDDLGPIFVAFPTWIRDLNQARMVGHRFPITYADILDLQGQEDGYFADVDVQAADSDSSHSAPTTDDYVPKTYHLIVKMRSARPWEPATSPEDAAERPMRAYRCVVLRDTQDLLALKEYEHPESEYFAPGLRYETNIFWATHSLASQDLDMQSVYNDSFNAHMLGSIAESKQTIFASNFVGAMNTIDMQLGTIKTFPGDPKFWSPPNRFTSGPSLLKMATEAERVSDGVMGISQVATGQLPEASQTATATGGALAATDDSVVEYQQNFYAEVAESVRFGNYLISRNFKDFKRFHGPNLKTSKASDWKAQFDIRASGIGPSSDPNLNQKKIETLLEAADALGIKRQPAEFSLDEGKLYKALVSIVDPPIDMEPIYVNTLPELQSETGPGPDAGGIGPGIPAGIPGNLAPPPGLLGGPAGGPGGVPGMVLPGPGGLPPIPPELLSALGGLGPSGPGGGPGGAYPIMG